MAQDDPFRIHMWLLFFILLGSAGVLLRLGATATLMDATPRPDRTRPASARGAAQQRRLQGADRESTRSKTNAGTVCRLFGGEV